ncbi:MAG: DUF1328 domain-containing protein [Rubrimonas sp.]
MLRIAFACLSVAVAAGVLGFGEVGTAFAGPARVVFVIGIAGFVAGVLAHASQGRTPRP